MGSKMRQTTGENETDLAGMPEILRPDTYLEILRKTSDILRSFPPESDDSEDFAERLNSKLIQIHRYILPKLHSGWQLDPVVDLVHFEYRSLVVRTTRKAIDRSTEIRRVFAPADSSLLLDFAREVDPYEPGRDILPQIECDFCTLLFRQQFSPDDAKSVVERGVYPIGGAGIGVLSKWLRKSKLRPWTLALDERQEAFREFEKEQQGISPLWNENRKSLGHVPLPDSNAIFEFALMSSITTLRILCQDLLSPELYERMAEERLARVRKTSADIREQAVRTSGDGQLQRALSFLPIRMQKSNGQGNIHETIGLVAYCSQSPLAFAIAASLAVVERLVFLTCRQWELFLLQNDLRKQLTTLELQRIFARLITHEAGKPLAIVRDSLGLIEKASKESSTSLERFSRGDLGALQNPKNIDLYDVMLAIRERNAVRLDKDNIVYGDEVPGGTYVYADRDAVRHTLSVLVDNAIAHGRGQVRITARTDSEADNHGLVVVDVANNGPAMLPDLEEAIREGRPPIRVVETARVTGGQGVGLNLAFEFARLNGWTLTYRREDASPLRHVFELRLPRASSRPT